MIDPISVSIAGVAMGAVSAAAAVKAVNQTHKQSKSKKHPQQQQQTCTHLQVPVAQSYAPPPPQVMGVPNGGHMLYPGQISTTSLPYLSPQSSSAYSLPTTPVLSPAGSFQPPMYCNSPPVPQCRPLIQSMYSSGSTVSLISQEGYCSQQFEPSPPQYVDLYPMQNSSSDFPDKKHHVRRWKN